MDKLPAAWQAIVDDVNETRNQRLFIDCLHQVAQRCYALHAKPRKQPEVQTVRCRFYRPADGKLRCAVGDEELLGVGFWVGNEFTREVTP